MKKIVPMLLASVMVCAGQLCFSQLSIGAKAGISIPNLKSGSTGNPVSSGWSSRQGPYFGLVAQMALTKHFGLQSEINYSSQGGKKNGLQAIAASDFINPVPLGFPPYVYANYNSEAKLNYLEVPVMLKATFPFAKIFSFFAEAGPYGGLLLSAKNVSSGSSNVYADKAETLPLTPQPESFDQSMDIKDQLNKFNFGIQGGIGFMMKLPGGSLMLTGGGNYGFVPIQKNEDHGKDNTGAATVTLGYLFNLK